MRPNINDRFTLLRDCCNLLLLKPLETLETVGIGGGGGGSDWSLLKIDACRVKPKIINY